jgi:hypothetical protein
MIPMIWLKLVVLLLLLPVCWWTGLPPFWGAVELAAHYAEWGEHCDDHCAHYSPVLEKPQRLSEATVDGDESTVVRWLVVCFHDAHSGDRPPPLLLAHPHGLRAPPTLILA